MDASLSVVLASRGGVARTTDLARVGLCANELRVLVREGTLVRLRHGSYVDGVRYNASTPLERYRLAARAASRPLPHYAVSHLSAVAVWGLPVLETDLGDVQLCGVDRGRARRALGVRFHPPVSREQVTEHARMLVVLPPLAVLQAAAVVGARAGLVAADAGLRTGLFDRDGLKAQLSNLSRPRAAPRVLELASPLSESPGESWSRLIFADLGVTQPRQQVPVYDEQGRFVARVDFLFDDRNLVVEFDGALKYAGAPGAQALVDEKRREDALRRLGYRVVRLTWRDLADSRHVASLLRP